MRILRQTSAFPPPHEINPGSAPDVPKTYSVRNKDEQNMNSTKGGENKFST